MARRLQLPTTGTLGVLLRAKQLGNVSKVRDVIDELAAAHFRVSDALRATVLAQAGE